MNEAERKEALIRQEELFGRVSRLENVKLALERAVDQNTIKLSTVNAATLKVWGNLLAELKEKSDDAVGVRFPAITATMAILREAQTNLDRITLPKIDNDMKDLEKRLRGVEKAIVNIWNDLEAKKDE